MSIGPIDFTIQHAEAAATDIFSPSRYSAHDKTPTQLENVGITKISKEAKVDNAENPEGLIEVVENIPNIKCTSLEQQAVESADDLLQIILGKKEVSDNVKQLVANLSELTLPLDLSWEFIALPLDRTRDLLPISDEAAGAISAGINYPLLARNLLQGKAEGSLLLYRRYLISTIKDHIEKTEKIQPKEKEVLRLWVKRQEIQLKKESTGFGLRQLAYAPVAARLILGLVSNLSAAFTLSYLWFLGIFITALQCYKIRQISKTVNRQKEWMQSLKTKTSGTVQFEENAPVQGVNREFMRIQAEQLAENISTLQQTRKERAAKREKHLNNSFDTFLETITLKNKQEILKKYGLHDEKVEKANTATDLKKALQDPEVRKALLKQYTEYQETTAVLTKNALQAQAMQKHKTERKFLKFELNQTRIGGTATILGISLLTVLKTLAIATAIAIPTIAISMTGVGLFAVSVALLLAGLYMLYRHKPNFMKEMLKFTGVRLAFYQIPAQIQQMRLAQQRLKRLEHQWNTAMMTAQNAKSSETTAANEKMQLKADQIEKKIAKLEKKTEHWVKKITPLQNRLKTAKWEDYLRKTRAKREIEGKVETYRPDEIIADGLLSDPGFPSDPETKDLLYKHFGIDLEKLQGMPDSDKEGVRQALHDFFAMDEKAITAFIQKSQPKASELLQE